MEHEKENKNKSKHSRKRFKGVRQQFSISNEAENFWRDLADELGKSSANQVKREILEAASGLQASNYYIALGELQKLAKKGNSRPNWHA